jgi:hypothetical protein
MPILISFPSGYAYDNRGLLPAIGTLAGQASETSLRVLRY